MRLAKVLWPEIIKGNRGPKNVVYLLSLFLKNIQFLPEGVSIVTEDRVTDFLANDQNFCSTFVLAKRHMIDKAPTYHLCEDFCKALDQIPDREIPVHFLPDSFLGYISFPTGLLCDETDKIAGAYVYIGLGDPRTVVMPQYYGKKMMWVGYLAEPENNERLPSAGRMLYSLRPDTTMEGLTMEVASHDIVWSSNLTKADVQIHHGRDFRARLGKLLVNTVLYIHSQDPELRKLSPAFGRTLTQARKHAQEKQGGMLNLCTIPVTALNWSYKASRSKDLVESETFVHSFPRWQPCGPGLSLHKLIWVREHTRTYMKHRGDADAPEGNET